MGTCVHASVTVEEEKHTHYWKMLLELTLVVSEGQSMLCWPGGLVWGFLEMQIPGHQPDLGVVGGSVMANLYFCSAPGKY